MIDLRSDTVTEPTEAMRKAAYEAEVGDDVYEEDPTVLALEEKSADMLGKEAALFVPSGTQGNQIAVLTHCVRGQEIIVEADSHIFCYEGAAISAFAGVQPLTITGEKGAMDPLVVEGSIRGADIHEPETGLICLENTHNRAGGTIVPIENMEAIYEIATKHNIPVHLDGARIFNAAVASGIDVRTYASYTDSVQFCLSKGLGAPVGSIVAGSRAFITQARKWRKRLGGGLRQAGIIAAPGIVALETMVDRLVEDHEHASELAASIREIDGLSVENDVDTNIVLMNTSALGISAREVVEKMQRLGVLASVFGPTTVRLTTHYGIKRADIQEVVKRIEIAIN